MDPKLEIPRHIRLVKQRRKIGDPYWLQDGCYKRNGLSGNVAWRTFVELGNYKTREAAIEALKQMPDSWGNKTFLLGGKVKG